MAKMVLKNKNIDLTYARQFIPNRAADAYKNQFGYILIIAGNQEMGGAGQMAALASVYSGAGLTMLATDPVNTAAVHSVLPEVMVCDFMDEQKLNSAISKASVILIGPGMGLDNNFQWETLKNNLMKTAEKKKLVVDGDALTFLAREIRFDTKWIQFMKTSNHDFVLTPHRGEWARLTQGSIDPEDNESVQNWVNQMGVYLILKGAPTKIYQANGDIIYINIQGNPGMSIGGMGDTLAGIIAGFLGQIKEIANAIILANFIHSYIADIIYENNYIVLPSEISRRIPATLKAIQRNKGDIIH